MPVTVSVETAEPAAGTLRVEWGGAAAYRPVTLPTGSSRTFLFLLRTGDPRTRVDVSFTGSAGARATIPVTVAPEDLPLVACVGTSADAACTVAIPFPDAPRDWRTYDTADAVQISQPAQLDAGQREAIDRWAGRRQHEFAFGLTPEPPGSGVSSPARAAAPWLALALVLPGVALLAGAPRKRIAAQAAGITAAILVATVAGRTGPGAAFRHTTAWHVFPGTTATLAETRLVIDTASDGVLRPTLAADDGSLESPGSAIAPRALDEDGRPRVELLTRLGGSYPLVAEYAGPPAPVRIERTPEGASIENLGGEPLTACEFPSSLESNGATAIAPRAIVALRGQVGAGDAVRCAWQGPPPPVEGAGTSASSTSVLVMHLDTVLP